MDYKQFVLLSGGLDSSTALYFAKYNPPSRSTSALWRLDFTDDQNRIHPVTAVSIDYGQRHRTELEHASRLCQMLNVEHRIISLPASLLAGSMLTSDAELPNKSYAELPEGISPTYVPFRNGLMLSMLAAVAQAWVGSDAQRRASIYIGAHAEDAARDAYPDCSDSFMTAMEAAISIGTYKTVSLEAPFINKTKAEIITIGAQLGVPYEMTWSCYKGDTLHCGQCPTCRARKAAFTEAGFTDPTRYAAE